MPTARVGQLLADPRDPVWGGNRCLLSNASFLGSVLLLTLSLALMLTERLLGKESSS